MKFKDYQEARSFFQQNKFKFKKEKLSYIDCLGYEVAKKLKIKFLTGDEGFRDKENVEFVK